MLAQWVFVRKIFARQGFIDEHHAGRTDLVATVECPPLQERYSHRLKISCGTEIHAHRINVLLSLWLATDGKRSLRAISGQWQCLGHARTFDAWQAVDPFHDLLEESRPSFGVRILFLGQRNPHGQPVFRIDSRRHEGNADEAVQQQSGTNQQNQRERHFRRDQCSAHLTAAPGRRAARSLLERLVQIRAGNLKGWNQPHHHSSKD